MTFLAAMNWTQWFLAAATIVVCFLLVVVILLQKGRGGGLAGAFGGAGGTSAFGAKTGDVFTWITVIMTGVFVLLTVIGNYAFDQSATAARLPETIMPLEQAPLEGPPAEGGPVPGTIEIGTTDPVTGEKKTMTLPAGTQTTPDGKTFIPITIPPSPAQPGTDKPADKPAEPPPAEPEKKPEEPKDSTP